MAKLTKRLSSKQLEKLAVADSLHIKRLVWEVTQSRYLLRQTRNLLEHWGDTSWQIISIRDSLIKELDDL